MWCNEFSCSLFCIFMDGYSTGVEVELGGERRLSAHSSAAMFCGLGLQVTDYESYIWLIASLLVTFM